MKRITLCGSTRFKSDFETSKQQLILEGYEVEMPFIFSNFDNISLTDDEKEKLDLIHFSKIDDSDEIFVIDVNGYIGKSTQREIGYAKLQRKKIKYMSSYKN